MKANTYGPDIVPRKGVPTVGAFRDRWHRYYWNGDGPLLSVTTAQSAIHKPAYAIAAARKVAEYVVENLDDVRTLVHTDGADGAVNFLRGVPDRDRDRSADFGTRVHALFETMSRGLPVTPEGDERAFCAAFARFLEDYGLTPSSFLEREYMVFDLTHRYGGTGDALLRLDERTVLVDYKTGSAVYGETEFQLAGLASAEFIGREGDATRFPIPKATRHAVLHVRPHDFEGGYPEGYRLIDYDITQESVALFRGLLPLKRWLQEQDRRYRAKERA